MIKYYSIIALRKLWRNRQSTLFNILGLSLGIACCILIALFINDDLGYDNFSNSANIYKLIAEVNNNEYTRFTERTPAPLKEVLMAEIPEIKDVVRFGAVQEYKSIFYKNKEIRDPNILLTDPEVFDLFNVKVIKGNSELLLTEPNSIVITKSFAEKLFSNEDPIGKLVSIRGNFNSDVIVTGVVENSPVKSSLQFNGLCPFSILKEDRWEIWNFVTYISIKDNTNKNNIEPKFEAIEKKYLNTDSEKTRLHIQPITKIHLDLNPLNKFPTSVNNKPIYLFSFIGLLILLIACFNYIILSTSNASKRNIEVGIQKVLGANRFQLIVQVLSESVIITIIASYFGVLLAENYLPLLNQLSGKQISIHYNSGGPYISIALFSILIGIISGMYPALFLSAFKPIGIFKREFCSGYSGRKNILREFLIMIQFIISITLIISTITIRKQLNYISHKDVGFDFRNILIISMNQKEVKEKYRLLISNLKKCPRILKTAATSYMPGSSGYFQSTWWEGMAPGSSHPSMDWISADTGFIELLKIRYVQGSSFTSNGPGQIQYILNKAAVQSIGWNNPLGKYMDIVGRGIVVGVVEDFNFNSLHTSVNPVALCVFPQTYRYLYLKLQTDSLPSTLLKIRNEWQKLFPQIEFDYSFLDKDMDKTYSSDFRTNRVINLFTIIAILLSCLGIYSLVTYSTLQRTKEIGIRKVTGATTIEIIMMLSSDLLKWVFIAFIIACPIAYLALDKWLQNFAYKATLSWWIFASAGLIAFVIAFLAMSWKSWVAANRNPVDALRYE